MEDHGIPVSSFCEIGSAQDCLEAGRRYGYPFVLKNALLAYDGRGNAVVDSPDSVEECYERLGGGSDLYAERFVPFVKELAVMVVRGPSDGEGEEALRTYPVVETVHRESICDVVICPAQIPCSVRDSAVEVAERAVGALRGCGVFGVELFMMADGQILYNEIAPRSVCSAPLNVTYLGSNNVMLLNIGRTIQGTTPSRPVTSISSRCICAR